MKRFLGLVSVIAVMASLSGCMGTGTSSGGSGSSSAGGGFMPIIMLVLIFAVMYFVMIRPQRKKQKEVEQMRSAVKPGDRITTIGGLKGKIVRISDETIMIEVGPDKVRMEFMKWAVSKVDEKGAAKSRPEKTEAKDDEDEQEEAPKTVKRPRRLGFKSADDEGESNGEGADEDTK
ncbi:MAG: preprotein translocase subunit YajC [Clostridiales Family XIII bacterium]|jgi:preprotein translocase subunit YajC|nr:preprotein translocase subunit YajC [Clostridiales Family XIII bacterium]